MRGSQCDPSPCWLEKKEFPVGAVRQLGKRAYGEEHVQSQLGKLTYWGEDLLRQLGKLTYFGDHVQSQLGKLAYGDGS
jgi:hypothetical protein